MKQYMEVGERGYYDKKRYRCVETEGLVCDECDLSCFFETPKFLCRRVLCASYERPDGKNVVFRLQPKYRKEGVK